MVESLPAIWEARVQSLGWEDPLEKEMATHSSTLAWKMDRGGQKNLVGYSPRGRKESNMTERIHFTSIQYDYGSLLFTKLCVYKNFVL